MHHVKELLEKTEAGKKKVRLLRITISNFSEKNIKTNKGKQFPLPF